MPLVDFSGTLLFARKNRFAVGAFNPVDYNSTRVIVETAQQLDAPVICQTSAKTVRYYGFRTIASWMRELCADTTVPVSLHLDHGKDLDIIQGCIDHGWTNVMIDASHLPFEDNLARSRQVSDLAAAHGVGIEAEIGEIHGVEEDIVVHGTGTVVDPDKAEIFCREVRMGVFAPAIGTAHGIYKGTPRIAWEVLEEMHRRVAVPFALHGGTGLDDSIIERCIRLGCAKVNISTQLKHAFVDGFSNHRAKHPDDYEPLRYVAAQDTAMREVVAGRIRQFGGAGQGRAIMEKLEAGPS